MKHPCEIIYDQSDKPVYGDTPGICKVTGKQGMGIAFDKWVKDTFTDLGNLLPGTIVSNEALFTFEEASVFLQHLTGKDKPQRFRNYSHFIVDEKWYILDKGKKAEMFNLLLQQPEVCVISDSGQKHLLFKSRAGLWQFEDSFIRPDVERLKAIHKTVSQLAVAFSVQEIETGQYLQSRVYKYSVSAWRRQEESIREERGSAMFDLALFFAKVNIEK